MIDTRILEWATPSEALMIQGFIDADYSQTGAGRALGVHQTTIKRAVDRVKQRAVVAGYIPEHGLHRPIPEPMILDRMTITTEPDGSIGKTWLKAKMSDIKYLENIRGAIAAFLEDVPVVEVPDAANDNFDDIIPWIQIGDAHFNMLAHLWQSGRKFDLEIATQEFMAAWSIMLEDIRPCERIVINDLGDFSHAENVEGETQHSRNRLDMSMPFPSMIRVYSRLFRWLVHECLKKAQHVDVIVNQGNHSRTNDMWMAELLRVAYPTDDRVHVINNDNVFIGYRMGNTFVMTHHSDKCSVKNLIGVMITDFAQDFGETEFHYIDVGHVHHRMVVKEHPSITLESFNNLAPNDNFHHDKGYRSKSSLTTVFRSKTYGEVSRRTLPIQEIWARLEHCGQPIPVHKKRAFTV